MNKTLNINYMALYVVTKYHPDVNNRVVLLINQFLQLAAKVRDSKLRLTILASLRAEGHSSCFDLYKSDERFIVSGGCLSCYSLPWIVWRHFAYLCWAAYAKEYAENTEDVYYISDNTGRPGPLCRGFSGQQPWSWFRGRCCIGGPWPVNQAKSITQKAAQVVFTNSRCHTLAAI